MDLSGTVLRKGHKKVIQPAAWAVLVVLLIIPVQLFAQGASPLTLDENAGVSASFSSLYQFRSNLDGGGDVSASQVALGIGGGTRLSDQTSLGLRLTYDREEYNFTNATGFAVPNPWNQIDKVGLSARLGYKVSDTWSVNAGPVIQYAGEDGARFNDSLLYGGTVSASYRVNPNLMVGFGAGVFYRLEETKVFPSLIVSWKINDRLRLGNSYRLGPAGPAGLELSYKADENWELAAGGGHRSSRFRLDRNGSTPGGIGENTSWPVYGRVSRKLGSAFHVDLFGGAAFGGKMKLQDSRGNDINSVSYNTAPLLGLNLRSTF